MMWRKKYPGCQIKLGAAVLNLPGLNQLNVTHTRYQHVLITMDSSEVVTSVPVAEAARDCLCPMSNSRHCRDMLPASTHVPVPVPVPVPALALGRVLALVLTLGPGLVHPLTLLKLSVTPSLRQLAYLAPFRSLTAAAGPCNRSAFVPPPQVLTHPPTAESNTPLWALQVDQVHPIRHLPHVDAPSPALRRPRLSTAS